MINKSLNVLLLGAISQSGSTLAPWAFQKNPRRIAFDFGTAAGKKASNSKILLQYLRSLPAERLKVASTRTSIVVGISFQNACNRTRLTIFDYRILLIFSKVFPSRHRLNRNMKMPSSRGNPTKCLNLEIF